MQRLLVVLVGALTLLGLQPVAAQAAPVAQAAAAAAVDEGTTFVPMPPRRVLDTRNGTGTGGKTEPVQHRVDLDLSAVLPASATAVVLNLTGTQPTASTYIRVSPVEYNLPDISNLNLAVGETRANQVTVMVPANRKVFLFNNLGTVHLVADVAGYYSTDSASRFTTTAPSRLVDTRNGAPVGPASTLEVDLSGVVPASATSVTFNLTGTEPTATTYVTAIPSGTARPDASNLNLTPGQTSPNLVTVALGTNRKVTLYNNLGTVHLIVDLFGYYASDRGHRFFPVSPVRAYDTRTTGGRVGPGQTRVVDLATRIPPTAAAAVLNLTGAGPTSVTFVTAYANGAQRPITSNLNLTPGRDTANGAVVPLGTNAKMALYNNLGSTELIADVAGFFATPAPCVTDCVYGWGGFSNPGYGPTPVRRPWLSGITSVDAGSQNTLALKSDGTVWSWGDNQWGQLGAGGTGGDSKVPLRVSGLTGVVEVAVGTWAGYALKSDGTVWAWGDDNYGQLGAGRGIPSNVPVQVYGLTGVTAIAASHLQGYALKSDGTVWAWGNNVWGGLGGASCPQGQYCPPGTPLRVPVPLPAGTKVTAIAAGGSETAYALRSDGTAWAWGRNWDGETGTGSPLRGRVEVPTQVVGLTGVTSITGGDEVGYATTSDGKVWAWGENYWGTLGRPCADPNTCQSNVPVEVQGLTGRLVIESGAGTTFALKEDGSVWAWGRNAENGNLGNGTTGPCNVWPLPAGCQSNSPVQTTISGVKDLAAGGPGKFAVVPAPN